MVDGGTLYLEKGFSDATVEKLRGYGHKIPSSGGFFGGYQAIMIDSETGVYFGASESRKDGQAAGY